MKILKKIQLKIDIFTTMKYYTVISCLFGESKNYATRCRGQLNALLPEAARPRAIVH